MWEEVSGEMSVKGVGRGVEECVGSPTSPHLSASQHTFPTSPSGYAPDSLSVNSERPRCIVAEMQKFQDVLISFPGHRFTKKWSRNNRIFTPVICEVTFFINYSSGNR